MIKEINKIKVKKEQEKSNFALGIETEKQILAT
jgi:hypothetical protein